MTYLELTSAGVSAREDTATFASRGRKISVNFDQVVAIAPGSDPVGSWIHTTGTAAIAVTETPEHIKDLSRQALLGAFDPVDYPVAARA